MDDSNSCSPQSMVPANSLPRLGPAAGCRCSKQHERCVNIAHVNIVTLRHTKPGPSAKREIQGRVSSTLNANSANRLAPMCSQFRKRRKPLSSEMSKETGWKEHLRNDMFCRVGCKHSTLYFNTACIRSLYKRNPSLSPALFTTDHPRSLKHSAFPELKRLLVSQASILGLAECAVLTPRSAFPG